MRTISLSMSIMGIHCTTSARQIRSGELQQLKGLLYFTDGCGTYPQRKPDYDTAVVFLENEGNQYEVPPWAIRLTLEPEEILEDV